MNIKNLTITKAYFSWVLISVVSWSLSWYSGELNELMGQAVDLVYDPSSGLSREVMIFSFIVMSLIYWLVTVVVSGLFLFFTNKGKNWAKYLLTIFCTYQIYYEISSYISISEMYEYTFGIEDWVLGILSITALLILGILPYVKTESRNS